MKKRIGFLLLAVATFVFVTTSCSDGYVDYDTYGSISGTVVEQDAGPVQDALVVLKNGGQKVYTGYDGSFEFIDLEGGRQYNVWAQKDGYSTDNTTVTVIPGRSVNVDLVLRKKNK